MHLPVYTGLVEEARSNNRQGVPVGAAYLRRASELMRTQLLPAAERLSVVEAQRADADYRDGTRNTGLIVAVVLGGLLLVGLVVTQVAVGRFTNRVLNVPMLVATVILVGLGAWMVVGLVSEQNALRRPSGRARTRCSCCPRLGPRRRMLHRSPSSPGVHPAARRGRRSGGRRPPARSSASKTASRPTTERPDAT
jgi:hypothetical protein